MLQLQFTTQAETRLYASKLGIGKFGMICRYANLMPGGNFPPSNTHQGQLPSYNCITKRHKHLPRPNHRIGYPVRNLTAVPDSARSSWRVVRLASWPIASGHLTIASGPGRVTRPGPSPTTQTWAQSKPRRWAPTSCGGSSCGSCRWDCSGTRSNGHCELSIHHPTRWRDS